MHVTFVCTGNICRSPMAEMIARGRHGDDHTFDSSGVWAVIGSGMTDLAEMALVEAGITPDDHHARDFTEAADTVQPDLIYVMTGDHLRRVHALRPDLADRTELLDPEGVDIADPYGGDLATYRAARDHIARAIAARFGDVS